MKIEMASAYAKCNRFQWKVVEPALSRLQVRWGPAKLLPWAAFVEDDATGHCPGRSWQHRLPVCHRETVLQGPAAAAMQLWPRAFEGASARACSPRQESGDIYPPLTFIVRCGPCSPPVVGFSWNRTGSYMLSSQKC